MPSKEELRHFIRDNLDSIAGKINAVLRGKGAATLEPVLARIGRGGKAPHWYEKLRDEGTLPNLDGKTIGSVIEMLLVGVLESLKVGRQKFPRQRINPTRGIDLPDLDLGVKSPSENYYTSEPFFSAYERLLGSEFDIVVLLTDYQTAKSKSPLRLQIIKWRYLKGSQVADENLCKLARHNREWLLQQNEAWFQKVVRFLAFVNQSDWLARQLLKTVPVMRNEAEVRKIISQAAVDFRSKNTEATKNAKQAISDDDLAAIQRIAQIQPIHAGVVDALDNWVLETLKEAGRAPNENEWQRLKMGPLDGMIGMSFALQWRYNFGRLFGESGGNELGA